MRASQVRDSIQIRLTLFAVDASLGDVYNKNYQSIILVHQYSGNNVLFVCIVLQTVCHGPKPGSPPEVGDGIIST